MDWKIVVEGVLLFSMETTQGGSTVRETIQVLYVIKTRSD